MRCVLLVVMGLSTMAAADPVADESEYVLHANTLHSGIPGGRFGFGTDGDVLVDPKPQETGGMPYPVAMVRPVSARGVADPKVAWYGATVHATTGCDVVKPCKRAPNLFLTGTVLLEQASDKTWRPLVWHLARSITDKQQAAALAAGETLPPVPTQIDAGAEPIVKRFRDTIGDPKSFAATISTRRETLMFGSSADERWQGGAAVAAQLARWKLAFRVQGGIQAGLTTGGKVGWVAANVDAVPAARPAAKAIPYRVTAIYELTDGVWRVVQLQFSFASNPYLP